MSDDGGHEEDVGASSDDGSFDLEPTKQEKIEMRKAIKPPSEWLKLLCREWSIENEVLVETTDAKFLDYKPYLKGLLTSQLLCRLSIPPNKGDVDGAAHHTIDFWEILGVTDAFDRAYIIAQIERFCSLYSIRAISIEESPDQLFGTDDPASIAAAAAAGINVSPTGNALLNLPSYIDPTAAAAAACAAAAAVNHNETNHHHGEHGDEDDDDEDSKLSKKDSSIVHQARNQVKDAEKALVNERKQNHRKEQRRITQERKEQKNREREELAAQKATERQEREASREDRRRRKLEIRLERDRFAQEQKEAALKRAAELVASNRVPIEITRGAAAAKAAQAVFETTPPIHGQQIAEQPFPSTKKRSAVVVSTALDLHQIVTHAKNLWAKYNAIAKEHNQKVNWITVARELGIHVKVREKYARMHNRAEQRGFDWSRNGHWKIKDHPEIFLEPTSLEQKAKMPPPPHDTNRTVLIDGNKEATDQAVAAAAAVVDASVSHQAVDHVVHTTDEQAAAAAAVAATLVADPTAGAYDDNMSDPGRLESV